jgi:uncharacterized protein (TIGR02145 family)
MKKALLLLTLSFSLSFAYTEADVYGAWNTSGQITEKAIISDETGYSAFLFEKGSFDGLILHFRNGVITNQLAGFKCHLASAKAMDCYVSGLAIRYKKAGTVAQYRAMYKKVAEKLSEEIEKIEQAKRIANRPLYKSMENAKSNLQGIYNEHKNIAKGEFESTADFNKRKAELDKELKDSTEVYFNNSLNSIVDAIESNNKFDFDFVKYDADKQIAEIAFMKDSLKISGKVKVPPEDAKNLKENIKDFSTKYENLDLRNVDYTLIPVKMSIHGANGDEYKVDFALPKNAKEIVFKGSELWKDNPYAKNLSVSLAKAIEEYPIVKQRKQQKDEVLIKNGLTDSRDGKKYKVVMIGSQMWMAENLNYAVEGSKCYEDNSENCDKYGMLYDWETAMKACPAGWHLPTKEEWDVLTATVGGEETEGKKLKATSGWNEDGNGTDEFGFAALPGGLGDSDGYFSNAGKFGYWWSASEYNDYHAYLREMDRYGEKTKWGFRNRDGRILFSVRCLRD